MAESSGKSLICQKIIASAQKEGYLCCYVDMEQTFDVSFAQKLGVDTDSLIVSQPDSLQNAFKVIDAMASAGCDIIVLDSVAALVPEEELDAEPGKQTIGLIASSKAKHVYSVELNKFASKNAVENAKRNNVSNITFACDDAGKYISSFEGDLDVVIMDPPRTGSTPKFLNTLVKFPIH